MKFKIGDRIRMIISGCTGTIEMTSRNDITGQEHYYVKWDHLSFSVTHEAIHADSNWESLLKPDPLSFGDTARTTPFDTLYGKKECNHKWVEVGFHHTKTVCYHCDIEYGKDK